MQKTICIKTIIFLVLSVGNSIGAEKYLGNKLHSEGNKLFIGGGYFSKFYCEKKLPDSILIYDVQKSEKIGVIQVGEPIVAYDVHSSGNIAIVDEFSNLYIYKKDLNLIYTEKQVIPAEKERIYFDWNATGDKIAYLGFNQDNIPYLTAYIVDLKTGNREKIADKANSLRWAKYDDNIYYKVPEDREADGWVYKYDVSMKTTTKTKLLGIEFSADGAYYVGSHAQPSGEEDVPYNLIYNTGSNLAVPDADIDVEQIYKLGEYNHFLGNSHKVLTQFGAPVSIFDVDTRKYVRPDMGLGLLGWSTDDSQLVFSPGECKVRIEDALTGQVIKEWTVDPGK